ncbi:MAG: hypothetical protein QNJ44_24890 [Rhodobacter sp.]|nr:hypothetical protein [Rhodobacter sp.]
MKRTIATLTAIAVTASLLGAMPAAADLTPWEKFCLMNSKPGKDLDNCLNGLPSVRTGPGSMTSGDSGQTAAIQIRRTK